METIGISLGIVLILITLHDVVRTVLSHDGAGYITEFWTSQVWRFASFVKYKFKSDFLLKIAGPLFLVGIILVWYFLLMLGWFLLVYNGDYSIKHDTDTKMQVLDYIYFLSSTFSSLGMGDYLPNGFPWTLVATTGALTVTGLTTLSLSYILPVVNGVVDRRKFGSSVEIIGKNPAQIIERAWTGNSANRLDGEVMALTDFLLKESFRSHVYPILHYYYVDEKSLSFQDSVLILSDALAYQKIHNEREGNLADVKIEYLFRAIDRYLANTKYFGGQEKREISHEDFFELCGVSEAHINSTDPNILERREKLLRSCFFHCTAELTSGGVIKANTKVSY